jgi:hypothetical protein
MVAWYPVLPSGLFGMGLVGASLAQAAVLANTPPTTADFKAVDAAILLFRKPLRSYPLLIIDLHSIFTDTGTT